MQLEFKNQDTFQVGTNLWYRRPEYGPVVAGDNQGTTQCFEGCLRTWNYQIQTGDIWAWHAP